MSALSRLFEKKKKIATRNMLEEIIVKDMVSGDFLRLIKTPPGLHLNRQKRFRKITTTLTWCQHSQGLRRHSVSSVVDPDPYWIRIQELPGSRSVFGIRIRIHTCKYRLKWRQKM